MMGANMNISTVPTGGKLSNTIKGTIIASVCVSVCHTSLQKKIYIEQGTLVNKDVYGEVEPWWAKGKQW